MDYGKMKVIELRAELQARGLDTKGVKAALIDRLKEALDVEEQQAAGGNVAIPIQVPVSGEDSSDNPKITPDTPRRRSSRSRTKSPEPIVKKSSDPDPTLSAVVEEPEDNIPEEDPKEPIVSTPQKPEVTVQSEQEFDEKILDEMDVDEHQTSDPMDEDALLADPVQEPEPEEKQVDSANVQEENQSAPQESAESQPDDKEKPSTDDERRGKKRRAESPSKEDSPKKRQRLPPPNIDDFVNTEDEPELDESLVQLSWFDSDLNLKINRETFCSALSLSDTGLALVWAGARANYGAINNGKYFFEMQLVSFNTKINYPNERCLHEIRCGWSTANSNLQLGESLFSYGIDSNGKKCNNSEFTEYGTKLNVDDVVGINLDLSDDKVAISFTINGKDQGIAFEFDKSSLNGEALFPHISTKNVEYKVNFGQLDASLWSLRRDAHKENELKKRRAELERKKKDLEKQREDKLKKKEEAERKKAEAEAPVTDATVAEPMESETTEKPAEDSEKPVEATEKSEEVTEKPVEATEKPAEDTEKPAEKAKIEEPKVEEQSQDEEEPILPEDVSVDDIDQDTPLDNCLSGYQYIGKCAIGDLVSGPRRPDSRKECEVIMMIGLPGAGKSHWALQKAKENPDKRYTLLGTKYLLERMKIQGEARKPGSGPGRWEKLIELCNRGLLTLNEIACQRRRNYILDQPHVYISDQRRKMRVYGDFKRIAVIVVPTEEEYKRRFKQRLDTEGKDIPEAAANEMRANLTLPELEYQWFNEILYSDLEKEAAQTEVSKENERGKKALSQRNRHNDFNRGGRDFNNRNDRSRWGGRNDRNDFRRNDRWMPQGQRGGPQMGSGYRRDYDYNGGGGGGSRGRNWNSNDNWMNSRSRGGYGGAPPPRPGRKPQDRDFRNDRRDNRRDFRSQQGGNNKRQDGGGNNRKFGNKSEWNSQGSGGGQWSSNSWNNYGGNQGWNSGGQWNQQQQQYGSNTDNTNNDTNQQWMAYYQQQQQQPQQNWYSSDQNYGGAFSSTTYDNNQAKQ